MFKWQIVLISKLKVNQRSYYYLPMESQPQNHEFGLNPGTFTNERWTGSVFRLIVGTIKAIWCLNIYVVNI